MEQYQFDVVEQHLKDAEYHLRQAGLLAGRFDLSVLVQGRISRAAVENKDACWALRKDRYEWHKSCKLDKVMNIGRTHGKTLATAQFAVSEAQKLANEKQKPFIIFRDRGIIQVCQEGLRQPPPGVPVETIYPEKT